ncbi:MAG: hypothetical protein LBI54_04285 [Lachnospiraceae bacterium]|nr:hypothetical protein [Lachnospiraceae bacterium]
MQVDTVMLPHLAEELRLIYFAKILHRRYASNNIYENLQDIESLFRDPESYFSEHGARQIITIQGDDDNMPSEHERGNNLNEPEFSQDENGRSLQYVGGGELISGRRIDGHVLAVYRGCPTFRVAVDQVTWLFKPLNVQEKLPDQFYDEVREMLGKHNNDWSAILSDISYKSPIKKLYDNYIGEHRRNSHSLLLRHEPEQYSRLCEMNHFYCNFCKCIQRYDNCWHECMNRCCFTNNSAATVLLGDLKLCKKALSVLERESYINNQDSIVLLPHHGASSGDTMQIDKMCDRAVLAVSYGENYKYRHPKFIYDDKIARITNRVAFVNENQDFSYHITSWN